MKLGLILSNDWELFGDGSGDFAELQREPLRALIDTADEFGARITVFAEMGQQLWGAIRHADTNEKQGRLAVEWEEALIEGALKGADVQAHLHPQWLDGELVDGAWVLDQSMCSCGELPPEVFESCLLQCKNYLEGLIRKTIPDYSCRCFRAGAFYLEPSHDCIRALRAAGFRCDSSAVPGLFEKGYCDYRSVPTRGEPWWIGSDISESSYERKDLLELPVYSENHWDSPLLRKLISPTLFYRFMLKSSVPVSDCIWQQERNRELLRRYPLSRRVFLTRKAVLSSLLKRVLCRSAMMLDYDQLPPRVFVNYLKNALNRFQSSEVDGVVPIMALGHTKGLHNTENLKRTLGLVHDELGDSICYWTVSDAIDYHTQQLGEGAAGSQR